MNDSLTQFAKIARGNDNGQNANAMFERLALPESQAVIKRAHQVRTFFQQGWFRLWRKNVFNAKVSRRDDKAFHELQRLEQHVK